jgi:adenylate kinase family enzyme
VSKLIIIRGPSAAGKSTVAKALMEKVSRPTALLKRDHYMFMFKTDDETKVPDKELLEQNILTCLERGFDVIFEGNFKGATHKPMLERIFTAHPDENYVFYLDVSLNETLKRHNKREEQLLTAQEVKGLYDFATPLGHPTEKIVPEHSSIAESVELIRQTAGI